MALSDAIEKLGRTIFEAPFSGRALAESAPELEEVRLAVIDAVKAKSHQVGRARVFSYDLIRIHLRGVAEAQTSALESSFLAEFLANDLRAALTRSSFRFPADFQVELRASPQMPGPGEQFVWIETEIRPAATVAVEPAAAKRRPARLIVVHGAANETEITLAKLNAPTSGATSTSIAPKDPRAATISPSWTIPKSTAPSPANTPTLCFPGEPASIASSMTVGIKRALKPKRNAGSGLFATG